MEFDDEEFHNGESNHITPSNDHLEEDNEVRMRGRQGSRGRSLEIEGCSYDDENDSGLMHNVSSNSNLILI